MERGALQVTIHGVAKSWLDTTEQFSLFHIASKALLFPHHLKPFALYLFFIIF